MHLSRREKQVVEGLEAGKSYKEIAFDLNLSYNTVKSYASRLIRGNGAENRTHIVSMVLQRQIAVAEARKAIETEVQGTPLYDVLVTILKNSPFTADERRGLILALIS